MNFSKDIKEKIEIDFNKNPEIIFQKLEDLILENDFLISDRIIRCIIFSSFKDVNRFERCLDIVKTDWRDIILEAEYIYQNKKSKRVRDFNLTFKENDLIIKKNNEL